MSAAFIHFKCRNNLYPDRMKEVQRLYVPDDKVKWEIEWPMYDPPAYTSQSVIGKEWADPDLIDEHFQPQWNSVDGCINRTSYTAVYSIDIDSGPVNPIGRTGLKGRGLLGKWGPNHAADPIVTRWKQGGSHKLSKKPILQFVAIKRRDGGEWAIPGGMVDCGEAVTESLKREFMEETLNIMNKSEDEKVELEQLLKRFFSHGDTVYRGYVDDPRNTDNAWMETTAVHFHDEDNESVGALPLEAGDDAVGVRWMDIDESLNLYASHTSFIKTVVDKMKAHW
ncbi:hypothetical protein V9T40_008833 [Parthenolecanium corni]|uniref:Nudix hydrolase domain-containing protein n=1 Tax=Parthenolecanium corni TaxID=536013 RepID=A0AAN9TPC1_9HEMI